MLARLEASFGAPDRANGLECVYREKDPDPEGKQLAGTKDPLTEATKLVQQLKQHAADRLTTHLLAFEVCSHSPMMLSGLPVVASTAHAFI